MTLRARITWLVAGVASAVIIAFVVPMCLLVQVLAEDRRLDLARDQAQTVATIVASVDDVGRLREAVGQQAAPGLATWVQLPSGEVLGSNVEGLVDRSLIEQTRRDGRAVTVPRPDGAEVLVPVAVSDGLAVVQCSVGFEPIRRGVYAAWAAFAAVGLVLLAGGVLVARHISERIATPVTELADVAHRLRGGELTARADPRGPGEVVELGGALNRLADRIGELLHGEREAAADLSHRLRTPVTALRLDVDLVADPELRTRLQGRAEDLHRAIDGIVADARRSSRDAMGGPCDALAVVRDRARHWRPLAEDQERRLSLDAPSEPLLVALGEQDLRDLVDNLIDNVFAHTPEGGDLGLTLTRAGEYAALLVDDAGPGGPADLLAGRGSSSSGSTGLGLDIVSRLARTAGGEVGFHSSPLGGVRIRVTLPLADRAW